MYIRVALLFGFLVLIGCVPVEETQSTGPPTSPPSTPTPAKSGVVDEPEWDEVGIWVGKNDENTPIFHIASDRWRVAWVSTPLGEGEYASINYIGISVYDADTLEPVALITSQSNTAETLYGKQLLKGPGDFYFDIKTVQRSYGVGVYAPH